MAATKTYTEATRTAARERMRRLWADGMFGQRTKQFDIVKAQRLYDGGMSLRAVATALGIKRQALDGKIKARSRSEATALATRSMDMSSRWSEAARARASTTRMRFLNVNPGKHPNRLLAGNRCSMSYPERQVFDVLEASGIEFQHNAQIGKYFVDFLVGRTAVEVDGERWHDDAKDRLRDIEIEKVGITVKRFPARRIKNEGPQIVVQYLRQ